MRKKNSEYGLQLREKQKRGSLLWVLDKTKTAMGKRLIRSWIEQPLVNITQIHLRQNAVEELATDAILRGESIEALSGVRDVERIMTKLNDKRHFLPVHVLLYTLPGIPSVYYGSEFGLEGKKERGSDASLRPAFALEELNPQENPWLQIIKALGDIYKEESALWYGEYREVDLTTTKYAFMRGDLLVTVTNSDQEEFFDLELGGSYVGALHGREIFPDNGRLKFTLEGNSAEIWIPASEKKQYQPIHYEPRETAKEKVPEEMPQRAEPGKDPEGMSVEELQAEVLARLAANGPVTDQMRREVKENVYRDSLLNWVKSFR